jgi:hypothetical protein
MVCYQLQKLQLRNLFPVAMRISNKDRSPERVHSRDAAPTPTGFAEIVFTDCSGPFAVQFC